LSIPPLIEDIGENVYISLTKVLSSKYLGELQQDPILDREIITSRRRNGKPLHMCFKGTKPGKPNGLKREG